MGTGENPKEEIVLSSTQGSTFEMRRKLSDLRGEGAKKAEEARVLAETSLKESMKDKGIKQDIHVPLILQEDVAKLMRDNELENATIIFSKNALNLFATMFAQSMSTAVKDAILNVEAVVERVVEQKLLETVNTASAAMALMMESMGIKTTIEKPVEPIASDETVASVEEASETVVKNNPRRGVRASREEYRKKHKIPSDIEIIGNATDDLNRTVNYLLEYLEAHKGESCRLSDACKHVKHIHKIVWMNPNHTVNYLMKRHSNIKRVGFGLYVLED